MKLFGLVNILGRLLLPRVTAAPGSPQPGEAWELDDQLFFRNVDGDTTLRVLTDADVGVPLGVASLGADGLVPNTQLPTAFNSAFFIPVGGGFDFYGDPSNIPSNCLVRDGAEYLRVEYPLLAAALRCKFGRPSTDEYFRVPDSIGKASYGAWAYPTSGLVRRVDVFTRGQGYTPGSYPFTFTGGTFSTAAEGIVVVVNETVPGVGVTGVIDHIDITEFGAYTSTGTAAVGTAANCGLTIPLAALPGGTGVSYDVLAQPTAGIRAPYSWAIKITDHGTGYTTPPAVSFTGGSLKGATAYAVIRDGGVAEVIVSNCGIGSTAGVTLVFTGGDGMDAAAEIRVETRYILPGDSVGEEQHFPLVEELVTHDHDAIKYSDSGSSAWGDGGDGTHVTVQVGERGDSFPAPFRVAGVGAIPLIRAV